MSKSYSELKEEVRQEAINWRLEDGSKGERLMKGYFDSNGFIIYMHSEFPKVFNNGDIYFTRDWLENTVKWVTETYSNKDTICATLNSMLPEIEECEIYQFWMETERRIKE